MNENVFADKFTKSFLEEEGFLKFLEERENNAEWRREKSNTLRFFSIEEDDHVSDTLEKRLLQEGKGDVFTDTLANTRLILKVQDTLYPVRTCAVKTILERARVSGHALNKVQKHVLAKILNYCMEVSQGDSLLRFCEDKVSAVHGGDASDYAVLEIPELFQRTVDYLKDNFEAYTFAGASYDHSAVTAVWMIEKDEALTAAYRKCLEENGLLYNEIQFGLRLTASDVGVSGANLYPMLFVGKESKLIPLGSPLKLEHKNKANMSNFDERLNMLYAQYSKALGSMERLMRTYVNHPVNTMLGIMKKVGVPKKLAFEAVEDFKVRYGDSVCTAYEVYLGITEVLHLLRCSGEAEIKILHMEENIARAITLRWKDYDIAGDARW